jgi:hypothetical protein
MKDTHETQPTKDRINPEEDQFYSPIENLQNITGGGFKNGIPQLSHLPKGIRFIGYIIIGFMVVVGIFAIFLNFK